jgi:hypothetical protein
MTTVLSPDDRKTLERAQKLCSHGNWDDIAEAYGLIGTVLYPKPSKGLFDKE